MKNKFKAAYMRAWKLRHRHCPCGRSAVAWRGGPVCARCMEIERWRDRREREGVPEIGLPEYAVHLAFPR